MTSGELGLSPGPRLRDDEVFSECVWESAYVCGECVTATTKDSISRLFDKKQKLHCEKAVRDLVKYLNDV